MEDNNRTVHNSNRLGVIQKKYNAVKTHFASIEPDQLTRNDSINDNDNNHIQDARISKSVTLLDRDTSVLQQSDFITLPDQLMMLLEHNSIDRKQFMWWLPDGKSFCITRVGFAENILDKYFHGLKFENFMKKMNRWGFKRLPAAQIPSGSIAYSHKKFMKGRHDLLLHFRCNVRQESKTTKSSSRNNCSSRKRPLPGSNEADKKYNKKASQKLHIQSSNIAGEIEGAVTGTAFVSGRQQQQQQQPKPFIAVNNITAACHPLPNTVVDPENVQNLLVDTIIQSIIQQQHDQNTRISNPSNCNSHPGIFLLLQQKRASYSNSGQLILELLQRHNLYNSIIPMNQILQQQNRFDPVITMPIQMSNLNSIDNTGAISTNNIAQQFLIHHQQRTNQHSLDEQFLASQQLLMLRNGPVGNNRDDTRRDK